MAEIALPPLPPEYRACRNPACVRKLLGGAAYCCGVCSLADEGGWDISGQHAPTCDERAAERGEWTYYTRPWS